MDIRILGPLEVRDGNAARGPQAPKVRGLLAALLLNRGHPVTYDRIKRLLWNDQDKSDIVVRRYAGELRAILGPAAIVSGPRSYTLHLDGHTLDSDRFADLVDEGLREAAHSRPERARALLEQALSLWRGSAFEGLEGDGFRWREVGLLRTDLERRRLAALCGRAELDLAAGRCREAAEDLAPLVAARPRDTRLRRLSMLALHRAGDTAAALETYRDACRADAASPELEQLHQRIRAGDPLLRADAVRLLPHDVPGFTGRTAELAALSGLIRRPGPRPASILIHGHAGMGKSALAVHAAWTLEREFPDGMLFADLRRGGPETALEEFLRWLGCPVDRVPRSLEERERLFRRYAAGRGLLVLIDNAEREEQVRPLLAARTTIITSRSPLAGLDVTRSIALEAMPGEHALELLAALSGASGGDPGLARLAEVCAGLPIALRIAGVRLASRPGWTPGYLASLLADERSRNERFRSGDLSLHAVFELGYQGLPEPEQALLRRLGALPGDDFADWVVPLLGGGEAETLVDAGLLISHLVDVAGAARYRLHDLTRGYTRWRLEREEGATARERILAALARHVMERVRGVRLVLAPYEPGWGGTEVPGEPSSFATADVRTNVNWLLAERAFLVGLVTELHEARLWDECWRLGHLLAVFFERHRFLDDWQRVGDLALDAARRAGHERGAALVLRGQADLHRMRGEFEQAHAALSECLSHFNAQGDARDQAHTLRRLGEVHLARDDLAPARVCLNRCLNAFLAGNDLRGTGDTLVLLGAVLHRLGNLSDAAERLNEAESLLRVLGDRQRHALCLLLLADVRLTQYEDGPAREAAQQAMATASGLRDRHLRARALLVLSAIDCHEGAGLRAAELAGEAADILGETGDARDQADALLARGRAELVAEHLDDAIARLEEALEAHRRTGDAFAQVRTLESLAEGHLRRYQPDRALDRYREGAELAARLGFRLLHVRLLNGTGLACQALGRPGEASRAWQEALGLAGDLPARETDMIRLLLEAR